MAMSLENGKTRIRSLICNHYTTICLPDFEIIGLQREVTGAQSPFGGQAWRAKNSNRTYGLRPAGQRK